MNKKLVGIFGTILSIVILIYFETFIYKVLGLVGINYHTYSNNIQIIINLFIKLLMCFMIYLIYKKDFRHSRRNDNIFKLLLILIVSVIGLTVVMYLFNYVVKYLCDIFNVNIVSREFYNIFDKKIDIYLGVKIINDNIEKCKEFKNIKINFSPKDESIDEFIQSIKKFGNIDVTLPQQEIKKEDSDDDDEDDEDRI